MQLWPFHAQPSPPGLFVIFIFQVNTLAYVETCTVKYEILCEGLILIFQEAKEQGVGGTACRSFCTHGAVAQALGTLPGLRLERPVSLCLRASGRTLGGAVRLGEGSFPCVRSIPCLWKRPGAVRDMAGGQPPLPPHPHPRGKTDFLLVKRG